MTLTPNFNFPLQAAGDNVGLWGTVGGGSPGGEAGLNVGIFNPLDTILGGSISISLGTGGTTALTIQNWQNKIFTLTGTLTSNAIFQLPFVATGGTSTAVGGEFIVLNNTTGSFTVTVNTSVSGSIGVTIPQAQTVSGNTQYLPVSCYSDGVNVRYANLGIPGFAIAVSGNPNGQLAGVAGSSTTNAQIAYDYTNNLIYVCTFTGNATGGAGIQAVWTNPVLAGQALPSPQGRLTSSSSAAVLTTDSIAATAIYYTPYKGSIVPINNGVKIVPFQFSQMQYNITGLTGSNIYDVFIAYSSFSSGVPSGPAVIGTGPSWTAGTGGSIAPGSCVRGTGTGSTQITRDSSSGLWVNTNTMTLAYNNGSINGTVSLSAGQAVYLGSIFIDTTAGQVSCYISWGGGNSAGTGGTPRKWGVWNAYNRVTIEMQCGDANSTSPYTQTTGNPNPTWATLGASSGSQAANQIQTFCGIQEEEIEVNYGQAGEVASGGATPVFAIGVNTSTVPLGFYTPVGGITAFTGVFNSRYVFGPTIGINNVLPLVTSQGTQNIKVYPGQSNCYLTAKYMG